VKSRAVPTAALVIVLALTAGCGSDLPGGPYVASTPESVSFAHGQQVVEALEAEGRPNRLDLHFWGFLTEDDRTYMTAYGKSGGSTVYLHLLVEREDPHITQLMNTGGYCHALLRGVEWGIRDLDSGMELVYKKMAGVVD